MRPQEQAKYMQSLRNFSRKSEKEQDLGSSRIQKMGIGISWKLNFHEAKRNSEHEGKSNGPPIFNILSPVKTNQPHLSIACGQ